MRLLVLSTEYHPVIHRGSGVYVTEICRALNRLGAQIHVITYGAAEASVEIREEEAGVWVYRAPMHQIYPPQGPPKNMHLNFGMLSTAYKLMVEEKIPFDLLHAHGHQAAWSAQFLAQHHKLPLVTSFYGTVKGRYPGAVDDELINFVSQLEAWLCLWSQKIITVSHSVKSELEKFFLPAREKTTVVYPGVDWERFRPADQQAKGVHGGEKILLFAGSMEEEKGPIYLLEAFLRVLAAYPQTRLLMVGEGGQSAFLKEWVKKHRLEQKIDFLGCLWGKDYTGVFQKAHIGVIPSLYEPMSIVSLEMMAAGLALVIFDTEGQRELVEPGVNGLIVPPKDVNALARALLRLLEDEPWAGELGKNAREKVEEHFSWPRAAQETLAVYHAACKKREDL